MKSLFAALALLLLVLPAQAAERTVLPTGVVPVRYAIEVKPDAEALTFSGKVAITLDVQQATSRIVLNAADLAFDHVALAGRTDAPAIELDAARQTAAFVFRTPIAPGRQELSIAYRGRINRSAAGLFALDYASPAGRKRALYTQFEVADARRFIPCWDEPALKAVFQITVIAPRDQMAVSNMPVAAVAPLAGGLQAVRFADTPKMSSYLAFLALGDFERVSRKVGDLDLGVVVRRGETAKAAFALEAAAQQIPYFNDYFGAPYPLPKLDLVAGPGQSQFFAAMENWGAIFFFEHVLLIDPKVSTEADRQTVFGIVAHEISHQWFGNLVTMAWWNDLWLNEGFASWMSNKAIDRFHPEWSPWLRSAERRQAAMSQDASTSTHPVVTPIVDAAEATNAFDIITYQKGQAVVRMLEAYLGEEAFRGGVRRYIARHAYANTVTDDLWTALDEASAQPVSDIAHDFILKPGVPLIRAEAQGGQLRLSQSRLGMAGRHAWRTPVTVAPPGGPPARTLLTGDRSEPVLPATPGMVVNAGQAGYFRTAYDRALWLPLAERFNRLDAVDQLGLIYDSRALGDAGVAPMSDFLDLAAHADPAADPVVLSALVAQFIVLDDLYQGLPGQAAFRAFALSRLRPVFARLGWDASPGEPDNAAVTRAALLRAMDRFGDPAAHAEADRRFAALRASPAALSGSNRETVLAIVARRADRAVWDQIHALARAATEPTEKSRLYRLLGAAADPALADRALALALSGEPSPTDVPALIRAVAQVHPDRAFDFALANRDAIEAVLEPASRFTFIAGLPASSRRAETAERVGGFAAVALPPSGQAEAARTVSSINYRAEVVELRLPDVDRWLAGRALPASARAPLNAAERR